MKGAEVDEKALQEVRLRVLEENEQGPFMSILAFFVLVGGVVGYLRYQTGPQTEFSRSPLIFGALLLLFATYLIRFLPGAHP